MTSNIEPPEKIYIAPSSMDGAGRGVFAKERIAEGELIEACPIVALPDPKDRDRLRKTGLVNYYFLWGSDRKRAAICLGWGSVYNHSFSPNSKYEKKMSEGRMDFYALRDIAVDEEIMVNYNGDPANKTPLRIPGLPPEAGGPVPTRMPWLIAGLLRRMRLAWARLNR